MAQFDVYKNTSDISSREFPFLLEIQSDLFEDVNRAVMVPLVLVSTLTNLDPTLNPEFEIESKNVALFPLDISSIDKNQFRNPVSNIRAESDRVIAALDLLFARY